MARLKISLVFSKVIELFGLVSDKDAADGAGSIIRPYMIQNNISLTTDQVSIDNATTSNTNFLAQKKLSSQLKGKHSKKYNPKLLFYKKCAQFLKHFYGDSFLSLGDWGIEIEVGGKIVYSANKNDVCDSIQTLITKHLSYAAGTSPLQLFLDQNNYNVTTIAADLAPTKALFDGHTTAINAKDSFRMERDNHIKPVLKHLRGIGAFLKGIFISFPANISGWGYIVVIDHARVKLKNLNFGHSEVKTIYNVKTGSKVTNTKGTIINAFKGKKAVGTAIIIPIGGSMIVKRGWGEMTLKNMSASDNGGISYTGG
jgi:hypothetical protein